MSGEIAGRSWLSFPRWRSSHLFGLIAYASIGLILIARLCLVPDAPEAWLPTTLIVLFPSSFLAYIGRYLFSIALFTDASVRDDLAIRGFLFLNWCVALGCQVLAVGSLLRHHDRRRSRRSS